jgi:hypothetical protein
MTDIEENSWQDGFCNHCGIGLRGEQHVLRLSGGFNQVYCSDYCRDQGLQRYISRPVFEPSRKMDLRDHILRSLGGKGDSMRAVGTCPCSPEP